MMSPNAERLLDALIQGTILTKGSIQHILSIIVVSSQDLPLEDTFDAIFEIVHDQEPQIAPDVQITHEYRGWKISNHLTHDRSKEYWVAELIEWDDPQTEAPIQTADSFFQVTKIIDNIAEGRYVLP